MSIFDKERQQMRSNGGKSMFDAERERIRQGLPSIVTAPKNMSATKTIVSDLGLDIPKPTQQSEKGVLGKIGDWRNETNANATDLSAGQNFFRGTSTLVDNLTGSRAFGLGGITKTAVDKWGNDWMKEALTDDVNVQTKAADAVNTLGASLIPMGAMYKGVDATLKASRAGGNAIAKLGQGGNIAYKANGTNLAKQSLAETGGIGSMAGLGYNVLENTMAGIGPGGDQRSNLERGLTTTGEAVLGGGVDVALRGLSRLLSPKLKNLTDSYNKGEINQNQFDEAVNADPQLKEEVATISPTEQPPSKAIEEFYQAIEDQYQYLKTSLDNRKGVSQGTIGQGLGNNKEITGAYRYSENPRWYQEFFAQHGRKPNNTELRELAEEQVLKGFKDETMKVPPYQPKEVDEIDFQIDELTNYLKENPEYKEALQPTVEQVKKTKEMKLKEFQDELANVKPEMSKLSNPKKMNESIEYENVEPLSVQDHLKRFWNQSAIQDPLVTKMGRLSKDAPTNDPSRLLKDQKAPKNKENNYISFRSKINRTPKQRKDFSSIYQKLRTQFVEDLAPLETLEKNIRGQIPSAENSLYKQARLFRGSPEKAHNFVRERIRPIIQKIEAQGYNYEDLGDYALARHAQDVNAKEINSGFTNEEIADVINRLGTPEMEKARKQLVDVSTDLLRTLENKQVLEPGTAKALRERWPNYMPLFRSFDDDKIEFGKGMSKALANVQNPIKKLEGSDRDVIDPIESMVKNTFKTFNVADRNSVALQLGRLADEDQAGNYIRRVKGDTSRKNVVSVMEDGKKVQYEVPVEVYKTISNLNQEASNLLIQMLQKPASMLRAGATLDPVFSLRNPMRDIVQAYVVSNSGFNPLIDFPAGLFNAIFKGRKFKVGGKEFTLGNYYQDFVKSNGGFGNIVSMDRDLHRKAIQQGLNEKSNVFVNVVNPKHWMELLRGIADVSETATKVGEFRAAKRKQGVSNEEAAYRARDIMDFSRAGTSIREANKVVAFLNANIQGKSKLIRAITENPGKVTGKAVIGVTAPTVAFYAASHLLANEKQRQAIDDAPQWLKESFWLTPIPGTNMVARIPKPFDLVIFSNPVERALDQIVKDDPQAWDGWLRELVAGQSLPIMMTGLAPFVEGMANYSFFRQGPVIPRREQDLNFPDQHDVRTTGSARFIADQINKVTGGEGSFKNFGSPRVVDNTIQGLTAGLGSYATNAIDALFFDDHYNKPDKPAKDFLTERTPLRGFLVNEMGTGQSMNELYELREQLRKDQGSARQNRQPFREGGKLKLVDQATGRIGDISKRMRQIENDPNLSSEEKRRRLEELNDQRNKVARDAWERVQGR